MAIAALRPEERTGLAVAIALHLALVAALIFQPHHSSRFPMPERIAVNLVDDVGLEATGPALSEEAQVAIAPTLSEEIAPPEMVQERTIPKPSPQPVEKPQPKPVVKPTPPKPEAKKGGGSRIGSNFLDGVDDGAADADAPIPASQIGSQAKASLQQAIARQLKPHWKPPSGADAQELVTLLAFDLNRDGSLASTPRVLRQNGVTEANRAQAGRHAELAIRAVQLAAPFDLPPKYYNAWKRISAWSFDWKSAQ